ncbi:MAG TPA: lipid A deacylase LpxR family protein [Dongiaceae bacterium]
MAKRQAGTFRTARGAVFILAAVLIAAPAALHAENAPRLSIIEENDSLFFDSDKHYTQGLRIGYLGPDVAEGSDWNEPFDFLGGLLPLFPEEKQRSRRYALSFGHSFFTPSVLTADPPDPSDRPYAGWLYLGAALLQDTDKRMLEHLELQLGVVGPAALGKQVQRQWHELVNAIEPLGWDSQLENEPGLVLSYERKWRFPLAGGGVSGVDLIPELGGSVGNVFTYGEAGLMLRFGHNLQADYGPARIRPALSGTDYFNRDYLEGDFGIYGFVGVQGRALARNIFLDGNSFRSGPSVDKEPLVADLQGGLSLFWADWARLDAAVMYRTEEFEGQDGGDAIGIVSLSAFW